VGGAAQDQASTRRERRLGDNPALLSAVAGAGPWPRAPV